MYHIPKDEVLRYLGYNGQEIDEETDNMITKCISLALSVCTPAYTYMTSDVLVDENRIALKGTNLILDGKDILNHLKDSEKCITLACTLGMGFEAELLKLQAKSTAQAVIFDAVGTAFIEEFADHTEEKLLLPYKENGYFSNFRFSPGYGDLKIELQQDIIATLDAQKKIGLSVTDTNILIPRKSITAFIGIFKTPQKKPQSKCEICAARSSCSMRKEGQVCD